MERIEKFKTFSEHKKSFRLFIKSCFQAFASMQFEKQNNIVLVTERNALDAAVLFEGTLSKSGRWSNCYKLISEFFSSCCPSMGKLLRINFLPRTVPSGIWRLEQIPILTIDSSRI